MLDKNGTPIIQTTKLHSPRFGYDGPEMVCLGYRGIDGSIILCQDNSGEFPIHLTQKELLTTHIWVVDLNFKSQLEQELEHVEEMANDPDLEWR